MTVATLHTEARTFRLGKNDATDNQVQLKLAKYLDLAAVLPNIPVSYGHQALVRDWGMLGNADYGDCVWAGAGHEHELWTAEAGSPALFDDRGVLAAYHDVTGFNPQDPNSDQGTDMAAACAYRRKTGVLDAAGKRHQIGAYLALNPGDVQQLHAAAYLFDGVGIGVQFPEQWMTAFNRGRTWGAVRHANIEGGHYITGVCRQHGHTGIVTWDRIVWLTDAGYKQFCDEVYVYLAPERLRATGTDINGFKLADLQADFSALTSV